MTLSMEPPEKTPSPRRANVSNCTLTSWLSIQAKPQGGITSLGAIDQTMWHCALFGYELQKKAHYARCERGNRLKSLAHLNSLHSLGTDPSSTGSSSLAQ